MITTEQFLDVVDRGCREFELAEHTDLVLIQGDTRGTAWRLLRDSKDGWVLGLSGGVETVVPHGSIADAREVETGCFIRHANLAGVAIRKEKPCQLPS